MTPEHRPGDEIEPAPVDQQVEALDARVLAIGVERIDDLGAGEDVGRRGAALAGLNGDRLRHEIGLIGLDGAVPRKRNALQSPHSDPAQ